MLKSRGPGDTRESLMLLADRYENHVCLMRDMIVLLEAGREDPFI